jgi:uncharacterized integral membrane protein
MTSATPEKPDSPATRWAVIKDRLAITGVVIALLFLLLMMIDGAVVNFRCSLWQFITFECNRWDATWKPWD